MKYARQVFFFFLFFASHCQGEYKYTLSICAIFQDETPFLKEWIEFHRLMGVEHFYLYNHQSKDHFQEVLEPYIQKGIVELINKQTTAITLKAFNNLQCKCYNECLKSSKGVSKWVAFLDLDEFLFPTSSKKKLSQIMEEYGQFGGIGVNWVIFGTSNVWKIPKYQLITETLKLRADKSYSGNRYFKSIVMPERTSHFTNPHHPIFEKGFDLVNTDKLPLEGMWSHYYQINKLRINHYWTRQGEYFYSQKLKRHKNWRGDPDSKAIEKFLKYISVEEDDTIQRFLPELKKLLSKSD